jgi:hypothetical protein
MTPQGYETPSAFRRALTDRLRNLAASGPWTLPQLQRQIAYDRLLERLYLVDHGWIVKGATALLARELGVRASIDVDVYREGARDVVEQELREAAAKDVGDWFRFEVGPRQPVSDGAAGVRLPISSYIGTTLWMAFHVDLVGADLRMTGDPDPVPAIARVSMPEVEQHGYRVYPLVDHVADKVVATFEVHGEMQRPSTRYRDLVDLVSIVTGASVEAMSQIRALRSEANRRNVTLSERFDVPDRALWEGGYAREAARSLLRVGRTLDDALEIVRPFLNPLLDGTAVGVWDPAKRAWSGQAQPLRASN